MGAVRPVVVPVLLLGFPGFNLSLDFLRTVSYHQFSEDLMARTKKTKTLADALLELRELEERATIHRVLSSYLRTRYLPRDSLSAQMKIPCNDAPVSEAMIQLLAQELDEGATEMETTAKAYQAQELDDVR